LHESDLGNKRGLSPAEGEERWKNSTRGRRFAFTGQNTRRPFPLLRYRPTGILDTVIWQPTVLLDETSRIASAETEENEKGRRSWDSGPLRGYFVFPTGMAAQARKLKNQFKNLP
jgi:hypothetical protein